MTATLVASGLAGGHGHRTLFEDLDLTVAPGDVVGVVGANGAGKSTLLRILGGDLAPQAGTVSLAPADAFVGWLPQEHERVPGETVAAFRADSPAQVTALLSALADQRPHALAAAQRGALFDPRLRLFGGAAEGGEGGGVAGEVHRVVAPFPGRDHPAIEVEDTHQFRPLETDLIRAAHAGNGDHLTGHASGRVCCGHSRDQSLVARLRRRTAGSTLAPSGWVSGSGAGASRSASIAFSSAISSRIEATSASSFSTQSRRGRP